MRISDWSSDVCSSDLPKNTEQDRKIRQASLQTPQPHRDHVRSPQGLEAGRYALRQMPQSLLLRHRSRRNRHLLALRSEEHTSELQSLMRISYAVFCLKKKRKLQKMSIS